MSGCATTLPTDESYKTLEKANMLYQRGDWSQAESLYKNISRKLPHDANIEFKLGNIYTKKGKYEEAIISYRKALVREPNSSKTYNNLAIALLMEAEQSFGSAIVHLTPRDSFGARACEMLGEVRSVNRNSSQSTDSSQPADWCRVKNSVSTDVKPADDWIDVKGPPLTIVQVQEAPQGACTAAAAGGTP